ncbi:hypothetical protein RBB50_002621 [Rhinocladiella similis]
MAMKSSISNFQGTNLAWSIDANVEDNAVPCNELLSVSAEIGYPLTELSALHPGFCCNVAQFHSANVPRIDSTASSPTPSISYEQLDYRREKQRLAPKVKGCNSSTTKEEVDVDASTTKDWRGSKQRRREQNRKAQRAHRLRKEAKIESLIAQLEAVRSEKENISKQCSDQRQEIVQLKSRIAQLANQLKTLC